MSWKLLLKLLPTSYEHFTFFYLKFKYQQKQRVDQWKIKHHKKSISRIQNMKKTNSQNDVELRGCHVFFNNVIFKYRQKQEGTETNNTNIIKKSKICDH